MWSLYVALLACIGLSTPAAAFPITHTVSQQCAPLNVTWKAQASGFPYTVWINANHGFVQTWQIDSNYQPGSDYITFQYVVPPPSAGFTSYTISVGSSNGDGNTTESLGISTPPGSSSDCPAYSGSAAFAYAADPRNGSMIQCGPTRFYNVDGRGTRPFTLSFIPLGGAPISVNIPYAGSNTSNFDYTYPIPFSQGTQFQIVVGDSSGPGSGGASQIYTVGPNVQTPFCLAEGYKMYDQLSNPLPISQNVATFANLPGAISQSGAQPSSGGKSHSTGAIAGGAIGGAIAVALAIGCLIAFLVYRKRQKSKRDAARSEEVRFVDLDGEDDGWAAADRGPRSDGASQAGRTSGQHYAVSPFVYEPRHQLRPDGGFGQSLEMTSPHSANPSYGELLSPVGMSSAGVSPTDDYAPRSGHPSNHSHTSLNPFSSRGAGVERDLGDSMYASDSSAGRRAAGQLPSKAQLEARQARRDARAERRVVQHTDGGSLPQPSSDTEDEEVVDELPPEYGGWLQQNAPSGSSGSGSGNTPQPPPPAAHGVNNSSISTTSSRGGGYPHQY